MRKPSLPEVSTPVLLVWLSSLGFFAATIWTVAAYGGPAYWPGFIGNFGASLAAFLLALSWDHSRERRRADEARQAAEQRAVAEEQRAEQQRITEARRRFEPVNDELRRNRESLDELSRRAASGTFPEAAVLHPQLLDGAWNANAARLTQLIADYDLISRLATTYGRIEELRWRLRERTSQLGFNPAIAAALAGMSKPLIDELLKEVDDLIDRVEKQIHDPEVQALGLVHITAGTVVGRALISGAVSGSPE